jgi:hypothetical protein
MIQEPLTRTHTHTSTPNTTRTAHLQVVLHDAIKELDGAPAVCTSVEQVRRGSRLQGLVKSHSRLQAIAWLVRLG